MKVEVWIGVGGNLPRSPQAIQQALCLLSYVLREIQVSSWYRTEPWGNPYQPPFWNRVIRGTTFYDVRSLFDFLQTVERRLGRRRRGRWEARVLDLDLLLYGDRVIRHPDLQIPHPWLDRRSFVLVPSQEVGNAIHPLTGQTLRWHQERILSQGVEKVLYR